MNVNRYQFDSIVAKTKKQISPIFRTKEDDYFYELALIECRLDSFHKKFNIDGRAAMEIIKIVLLDINAAIINENWDSSNFEKECYSKCVYDIESLFFPGKGDKLDKLLKYPIQMDENYFELARKVLVRIYESVEQWTNDFGCNGYFHFISNFIGDEIVDNGSYLVESSYLKD